MRVLQPLEGLFMRVSKVRAKNVREGDQVVVTVGRVLGMQGRKPQQGAPLMKIELDDGTSWTVREDEQLQVLRGT
jgi:hypothetical protein